MSPTARGRLLAALAIGGLALAVWYTTRKPTPTPPAALSSPPEKPTTLDAKACKSLTDDYDVEMGTLRSCKTDDDCMAEARHGFFGDLDGCTRVTNKRSKKKADAIANEWLLGGCAHDYPSCEVAVPAVACRNETCRERPPHPIPEDWHRVRVRSFFTLFVPPDMKQERVANDETYGFQWAGPDRTLLIWVDFDHKPIVREPHEKVESVANMAIDGRAVKVETLRVFDKLLVDTVVPDVQLPWYAMPLEKSHVNPLRIQLMCTRDVACSGSIATTMLSSIEILVESIVMVEGGK